jgi:hypothetical protein
MSQPLNFRNAANTVTFASVICSSGDSILSDSGIVDFVGKTTDDPCYLKNGRMLPSKITNTADSVSLSLKTNNNFHINTSASISTINLTNIVEGQSGHIVINNTAENTHSVTWQVDGGNATYIKWHGGSAPTLSSTSGYVDIISYYVYSTTCILLISSIGYYYQ